MIVNRTRCLVNYALGRFLSNATYESYLLDGKFKDAEKEKILSTLNSSNAEELSKFDVTQTRLKELINWKNRNGSFTTLSDLLDVGGLEINGLEKLCDSIVKGTIVDTNTLPTNNKQKRSILTPILNKSDLIQLKSAVGLHVGSSGVSWAKLERQNNELTSWGYNDFNALPKKVLPVDNFNLAVKILQMIPVADIYVLENKQSGAPGNNPSKVVTPYLQQLELSAMLLALINSHSNNTNISEDRNDSKSKQTTSEIYKNKVYYLRARLPARLFNCLVGSERVSAEATVMNILEGNAKSALLPCSKVLVSPSLSDNYYKCSKGYKDLLEQAFLLVIAFMDLCVYNKVTSHEVINKFKK